MKLRSALDKAREERGQGRLSEKGKLSVVFQEEKATEWKPPVYCNSLNACVDPKYVKKKRCVCIDPKVPEIESYKILRTEVMHRARLKNWRTVLVTSASPGEGKSLTTVNLGLSFAMAYNQTVLLVDCDLRHQSIHECLGIDSAVGIADSIVNGTPLEETIVWPGIDKLSFISGGRSVPNSAEVLGSPQMRLVMEEMQSRYDDRFILLDSPPILGGADTVSLAPLADCIIIVVLLGKTKLGEVEKALQLVPKEKVIGFVMNQLRDWKNKGYYY